MTIIESLEMLLDRLEREDRPLYDGEICREAIWEIKRLQEFEWKYKDLLE